MTITCRNEVTFVDRGLLIRSYMIVIHYGTKIYVTRISATKFLLQNCTALKIKIFQYSLYIFCFLIPLFVSILILLVDQGFALLLEYNIFVYVCMYIFNFLFCLIVIELLIPV